MFITFEGIDGCGKTTVLNLFAKYLQKKFPTREIIVTREPGGTGVVEAEKVREIALDRNHDISPYSEMLLMATSRRMHLEKLIWPALKENKIILCDRYIDSSIAYQGFGLQLGEQLVSMVNNLISNNTKPDITFFIDVEPKVAFERMSQIINHKRDRLEIRGRQFYLRVIEGFNFVAKQRPNNFFKISGNNQPEEVLANVINVFEKFLAG
ncbi:Thymidylate kinase [Mesomycoplasma conjunctivae]|uniref:Thymidylate kinase n=1 Tax=Mesomycoplasma conjunctivae (strain ATCC 25834 / NCTC 10147 / HRC/581) TaxID=572263 RepID=C5J6H7_MESCH|nr:dTMP kinase [Mesomycoplasma conjunctivae]CAT05069.1 Thymidylate kinase [Mesomycoplasma conjunctivae]VEU66274.1 Thymidylate kinase [Mesomycoplasma conjunctivae]